MKYANSLIVFCWMISTCRTSLAFVRTDRCRSFVGPTTLLLRGGSTTTTRGVVAETNVMPSEPQTSSAKEAFKELSEKLETITHLGRATAVLSYDQLVFMPSSASEARGKQMSALAGVVHEMKTHPDLLKLIDRVLVLDDEENTLNEKERRLIILERKAFLENERVPSSLAKKAAGLSSSAYGDWVAAKEKQDFSAFAPTLQDCFDTAMDIAKAKRGDDETMTLYDQMLDEFEVGMPQSRIDQIFDDVQSALVPLIARVLSSSSPPSSDPLKGTFDINKQQELSEKLVTAIGYEKKNGRIDVSVHPFSSSMGGPSDVRITSRFRDDEFIQGLMGSLHEGGHAIYEQQLQPSALSIDTALSMGTHESQSLFWERHIGLSRPFWKFAHPFLKDFDPSFEDYTPEQVYGAVNHVSKSFIRVEADELTYPLHVILRYNIEKDVIAGKLPVSDISQRWNEDMKKLLDVDVKSDDKGALQDVHWSALAFGYFPTYLIGSIAAAQLYHYCKEDIPDIESLIENGNMEPIRAWLKKTVHQHGRLYPSLDKMFEDQLGEPLNSKYFIDYLSAKYTDLYKLDSM